MRSGKPTVGSCLTFRPDLSRQRLEGLPRFRIKLERFRQVGRHGHLARRGIELDVDVHLVAAGDTGAGAILRAHPDHEHPAHGHHSAAVGVTLDRALTGGRLPAPRPATTSSGTRIPVAVLPLCSILARNLMRNYPGQSSAARSGSRCRTGRAARSRCRRPARRGPGWIRRPGPRASRTSSGSRPW